jgi:hypothetical protein
VQRRPPHERCDAFTSSSTSRRPQHTHHHSASLFLPPSPAQAVTEPSLPFPQDALEHLFDEIVFSRYGIEEAEFMAASEAAREGR